MPTVEIVCLANSWKRGGRCVAGLRTDGTGWVRPVSAEPEGILQAKHYQLAWGREAAVLDILNVPLLGPQPAPHHPEDWRVDTGRRKRGGPVSSQALLEFLDQGLSYGPKLLGDCNEKISHSFLQCHPAAESLALVRPETLSWQVRRQPDAAKPKIRAQFVLADAFYSLPLTDPVCLHRLANLPDGDHAWDTGQTPLLTISLGEPFGQNADCYKLVAGVISLPLINQNRKKLWRIIWDWTSGRAG